MNSTYREIKFRFFSNPDEKMYALTLLGLNWAFESDPPVYEGKIVWNGREGTRVQKYSDGHLMQFTGLKDKNGKEIYEGDIVKTHYFSEGLSSNLGVFEKDNTITGDIQYRQDFATYVVNTKDQDFTISEYCQEPSEELEVIGNLYENPELIGGVLNNENKTI